MVGAAASIDGVGVVVPNEADARSGGSLVGISD
jgi:hypothetical protein